MLHGIVRGYRLSMSSCRTAGTPLWHGRRYYKGKAELMSARACSDRVGQGGLVISDMRHAWPLTFHAVAELVPGSSWQHLFSLAWPGYRRWYMHEGQSARADLATCRRMLAAHMPELVPTWQRLVDLAGWDDLAARMLTLYNPPAYVTGCSQAVHIDRQPVLVRNYDYAPELLERVVIGSAFTGRRVIGMSDCLWGLVDGMNDAGLAVSLAFGGRPDTGSGFGIPLVLRYVLEACDSAAEARATLARLPVHMTYNVTVVDRTGDYFTAYLGPGSQADFVRTPFATNLQPAGGFWPTNKQHSLERQAVLADLLYPKAVDLEQLVARFLQPPLYSAAYERGFGTLYTAIYRPAELTVDYRWPGSSWSHSIGSFASGQHEVVLRG